MISRKELLSGMRKFPPHFFIGHLLNGFNFKSWPKKIYGLENLKLLPPDEGVLFTPMHPYHMDQFILGHILIISFRKMKRPNQWMYWLVDRRVGFTFKKHPICRLIQAELLAGYIGMYYTKSNINRNIHVLNQLSEEIECGGNVMIFPEGKVDPRKEGRGFWGAAYVASKTDPLIMPVGIRYNLPFKKITGSHFQMFLKGARDFFQLKRQMIIRFGQPYHLSDFTPLPVINSNPDIGRLKEITGQIILPKIRQLST